MNELFEKEIRIEERICHNGRTRTKDVLQERVRDQHRESSTTTPATKGWGEWKDVPIVRQKGI
jgi:hypothetical protein